MSLALNKPKLDNLAGDIWKSAERLSVAKEHLLDRAATPAQRNNVEKFTTVHGQELSPTNYAICQADLLIKNDQQVKVFLGNSLIPHDPHRKEPGDQLPEPKHTFDFMLSNPPFGVTWGGKDGYEAEAKKLKKTRYQAGMPRVNDGALLLRTSPTTRSVSSSGSSTSTTSPRRSPSPTKRPSPPQISRRSRSSTRAT